LRRRKVFVVDFPETERALLRKHIFTISKIGKAKTLKKGVTPLTNRRNLSLVYPSVKNNTSVALFGNNQFYFINLGKPFYLRLLLRQMRLQE
jgi:hypothetical protein